MTENPTLSPTAREMLYQFKLSVYQIRVAFLLTLALSLLFLGWGGTINIIMTVGTLDPVNPPANAWPTLASVSSYLVWVGVAGILVMVWALIFFVIVGRKLKKEAESFK